jgi:hypothetical protein
MRALDAAPGLGADGFLVEVAVDLIVVRDPLLGRPLGQALAGDGGPGKLVG